MNLRRKAFAALMLVFILGLGAAYGQPIFENSTPRGFSPSDSTITDTAITGNEINVLVDLNEAANFTYPVIGNFQQLEKSVPYFSTAGSAGYMSQAVAVDGNGVVHRAWIQQRGTASLTSATSNTPVYGVVYAKSFDGGKTFSDTVSVSGTLRFDMLTPNLAFTGAFSTVDIVVNSKGNPRVVYAMDQSADGLFRAGTAAQLGAQLTPQWAATSIVKSYNNVYFNYSNDGGSSWLPANSAVVVNDTATVTGGGATGWAGRNSAFPRMVVSSTDDIFITYERGLGNVGGVPDIMLTKVDEDSLKLGSAQSVQIGSLGNSGSNGGVRVDPDGTVGIAPDIAIGDDDVLHVAWYDDTNNKVVHKTVPATLWDDVTINGWEADVVGGDVSASTFDPTANAIDGPGSPQAGQHTLASNVADRLHLFPTVVVDKARTPDRVYIFWKHADGDPATAATANDQNINYNIYNYDGQLGAPSGGWGTSMSTVFPTGAGLGSSGPMFQSGSRYQVESSWAYVDRVAAVADDRKGTSSDIHLVFSGGASVVGPAAVMANNAFANSLYYTRYNGTEWELPQVLATARDGANFGIGATYQYLFDPDIAKTAGDDNVYMTFVGGISYDAGNDLRAAAIGPNPGRGYGTVNAGLIEPLAFFKVIGRNATFEDASIPKGGYQYVLSYTPKLPLTTTSIILRNMVVVTAADNQDGSGIGASTPGTSKAPGGFLTGQWQFVGTSLGVSSLTPSSGSAIYKGAVSNNQAQNDNGVFEGKVDDSGTNAYAEWGDDTDKVGLLVKLNVLGSNSADGGAALTGNVYVINASTAAERGVITGGQAAGASQAINLAGYTVAPLGATFVRGITTEAITNGVRAPLGSYFQIGARVDIIAANVAPVLSIVSPDASTADNGAFVNESATLQYTLYDSDDSFGTDPSTDLFSGIYAYPDNGLSSVQDIKTFGWLIVDQQDDTNTTIGTDDFKEGSSSSNTQTYTWDDPGTGLQALGFAALTKMLDGTFYIYIVADDGSNPPVFAVSEGPLRIRHIPLIKSLAPVAADTVDTGEYTNLDKANPYKVKFTLVDYNDNAQVRLFVSTSSSLSTADVNITGDDFPNQTLELTGATPIQLSDSLRTDEDIEFDFDVTAQGSNRDSVIVQGNYFIYTVVADKDTFAVAPSSQPLAIRHSPAFEFTAPLTGVVDKLNSTQQFKYTVQWQRGRSDQDLDGNAIISLYYTDVDPNSKNYSGTDSTSLVATSGTLPGNAVLIAGGIREDDEGANDQFIWDFRNPPSALPKVYLPKPDAAAINKDNPYIYQAGTMTDTAWVYAVLHDSLGNTRVQAGGAVLLLGSSETPASPVPRVVMKTPPAGGMTMVNGDVVRLEWDDFLIDDGTGTDDAYLRLYAAPKGKYSTLTELESNNFGKPGGGGDVYVLNSLDATTFSGSSRILDYSGSTAGKISRIRESDENFFLWDTKTTSFQLQGTPTELDIFIAGSMNPRFGEDIYVNGRIDSIATGIGSEAQKAVLSKSPGALRIEGADPIYSVELGPAAMSVSSGDTLDFQILVNSQRSSIDVMALHLDVPRNYFEVIDQDAGTAGMQPFADSTGAFKTPSTIAQNDTTPGTDQFIKLNFVEGIITGEVIGNTAGDSSQVAGTLQLKVKTYSGGAPLDTFLVWSVESGRKTAFRRGTVEYAAPARETRVKLTPRAKVIATAPLEGRADYGDTLDIHVRQIGSTHDITDQAYIAANDVSKVFSGGGSTGTLEDSVQVVSDAFGTFSIKEIPPGIYEMTVKAKGYVSGRTDTLTLFNGAIVNADPTYGSDLLGNLSPAQALGELRGGDATGDNQVDIADANRIFSLWNKTPADSVYVRDADVNADNVINTLDLGFVTSNFGNDGYGAPPVFKRNALAGDNSAALVEVTGIEDVDAWWPGKVFEVTASVSGVNDLMAYGFTLSYDPELVKPMADGQVVEEGDIFADNPQGSLFFNRLESGKVEVTAGRIGKEWSASGDGELATVRFVTLGDDPGQIQVTSGELVNSDYRGVQMRVEKVQALPKVASLHQNFPNPFNPSTEIRFDIPTARDVQLKIYNQLGQTIRTLQDQRLKAGSYRLQWDGSTDAGHKVSSGVYFYSLEAGDFSRIRKMTLVK